MPDERANDTDVFAWVRMRWPWITAAVLLLLVLWLTSGGKPESNGRYMLVKDDVPCEGLRAGDERRWCYVVLDTRTGKLEERVRKFGGKDRKS